MSGDDMSGDDPVSDDDVEVIGLTDSEDEAMENETTDMRADDAPPNAAPAVQQNTPGDHTTCETCGDGDDEHRLILCDGCDKGWHTVRVAFPKSRHLRLPIVRPYLRNTRGLKRLTLFL
jgi:hypothetical protein